MADIRSDFESDVQRFSDLLRWTDGIAAFLAAVLAIFLMVAWWPT